MLFIEMHSGRPRENGYISKEGNLWLDIRKNNITMKITNIGPSCPESFWSLSLEIFKIQLNTALIRAQSEFGLDPTLSMNLDWTNCLPVWIDSMDKGMTTKDFWNFQILFCRCIIYMHRYTIQIFKRNKEP